MHLHAQFAAITTAGALFVLGGVSTVTGQSPTPTLPEEARESAASSKDVDSWQRSADVATAVGVVVTAVGLSLVGYQIWLQRQDQKNQTIAQLFDEFVTADFRRKLQFVYSRAPVELKLSALRSEERHMVEDVTARIDALGFRARLGLVPKDDALHLFWPTVLRCAQQLQPHLRDQRDRRGVEDYKDDFDWFTIECKRYQLRRLGQDIPGRDTGVSELLVIEPLTVFRPEDAAAVSE